MQVDLFKQCPLSYAVVRMKIYIVSVLPLYSIFSPSFPEDLPHTTMYQVLGSVWWLWNTRSKPNHRSRCNKTLPVFMTLVQEIKAAGGCESSGMAVCNIAFGKIGINLLFIKKCNQQPQTQGKMKTNEKISSIFKVLLLVLLQVMQVRLINCLAKR